MEGGQGKTFRKVSHLPPVTAPTTGTEALPANEKRYWALIVNDSNRKAFLYLGALGPAGQGIPLYPNGYSYQIDRNNLFKGPIYARGVGGNVTLQITEGA